MPVKFKGMPNLTKALQECRKIATGRTLLAQLGTEVGKMAADIQRRAQEMAPVKEGTLRGEARSGVQFRQASLGLQVWFGGLASSYAEEQHENTHFRHPKGGKHHFLYGKSYSAWSPKTQAALLRVLDKQAERIAREHIGNAARG